MHCGERRNIFEILSGIKLLEIMLMLTSAARRLNPQVGRASGCSWCAGRARRYSSLYPDFYAAQRALRHDIRMIEPDMRAHAAYQRKYHRYQLLISALQGYHAHVKEYDL